MMMKGSLRLLAVAGVLAFGANAAQAAQTSADSSDGPAHELRVVNRSTVDVRVYVKDADGQTHTLAEVGRDRVETVEVPAAISALGAFQIKVLPVLVTHWGRTTGRGIRTQDLNLPQRAVIQLWLEKDLAQSRVAIPAQ